MECCVVNVNAAGARAMKLGIDPASKEMKYDNDYGKKCREWLCERNSTVRQKYGVELRQRGCYNGIEQHPLAPGGAGYQEFGPEGRRGCVNRGTGVALFVVVRFRAPLKCLSFYTQSTESGNCLLYTSPSPRDRQKSRMPSSA